MGSVAQPCGGCGEDAIYATMEVESIVHFNGEIRITFGTVLLG